MIIHFYPSEAGSLPPTLPNFTLLSQATQPADAQVTILAPARQRNQVIYTCLKLATNSLRMAAISAWIHGLIQVSVFHSRPPLN